MIIRLQLVGTGGNTDPFRADLPAYTTIATDETVGRIFADVPVVDVPDGVAAFVRANPVADLLAPLPGEFPLSLARQWQDHLARRYDLGEARWKPVVA